ncbi:MAG: DUF4215 domain-containing protein, partial [Planctomycetota bacterium]
SPPPPPPPPPASCGNGIFNTGEDCDGTQFEPTAPASHGACRSDCTYCGNGAVDGPTGSETCDDGNAVDTDGCRNNCTKCGDGIRNATAGEQCDDGNTVNGDGCSPTCQLETAPPPPPPPPPPPSGCGDGVVNGTEQCDTSGESATCNTNCTTSRCGDGIRNATAGEQCDDGNSNAGDGCANCQTEAPPSGIPNETCNAAIAVGDGTRSYSNLGATTDGPDEPTMCNFFGRTNVDSDIWYCYTASCTGTALVSLCGSDYDTKLAVYAGCGCPTAAPLACSDDDCGTGVENVQSRVTFAATAGQSYLVRVGGYLGEQGDGRLTIGCNVDACGNGSGDCFTASPTEAPGCGDA